MAKGSAGQYSEGILARGDRYQKVRVGAGCLAAALVLVAFAPEVAGVGAPGLGGLQIAVLVVAGFAAWLGLGLGRLDGRYLLVGGILMLGLASIVGLATLGQGDVGFMLWQLQGRVIGRPGLALHQNHPRFGWVNRAEVEVEDRHYDYRVRYRTNGRGERHNQNPPEISWGDGAFSPLTDTAQPDVVCLGCSFTFGQGVEDWETYAARWQEIKQRKNPEWRGRVVNGGVNGWGTVQVLLRLEEMLKDESPEVDGIPPMIAYGFLPLHAGRNDRRRDWLAMLAASGRGKPVLRQQEGAWVFDKLIGVESGVEADLELEKREIATTLGCIAQMEQACDGAGVSFYCLLLGEDRMLETPAQLTAAAVREYCELQGIPVVDLTDFQAERHPHDGHPTASWHRRVAERLEQVMGRSEIDGA
jgi:hypothetical protein